VLVLILMFASALHAPGVSVHESISSTPLSEQDWARHRAPVYLLL
jgi:hypothetical protein